MVPFHPPDYLPSHLLTYLPTLLNYPPTKLSTHFHLSTRQPIYLPFCRTIYLATNQSTFQLGYLTS